MQLFYVFDKSIDTKNLTAASAKQQHKSLIQLVTNKDNSSSQQSDDLTFRVHPIERNKILVRIENLADRFDANSANNGSQVKFVNIMKFAKNFW